MCAPPPSRLVLPPLLANCCNEGLEKVWDDESGGEEQPKPDRLTEEEEFIVKQNS